MALSSVLLASPMTHISILTADNTVLNVSVEVCKQSLTLSGLLKSYSEDILKQLQPIPFQYPEAVHLKLIHYWNLVTAGILPDRDDKPFFTLTDAEIEFMEGISFYEAAQMMGSMDFVHVLGLKLALKIGRLPAERKRTLLGFDDRLPAQKIAEVREQMGQLLLGLLHLK